MTFHQGDKPAKTPSTPSHWERISAAKERAVSLPPEHIAYEDFPEVRPEILLSWKRSLLAGVDPSGTDIPVVEGFNPESKLARAAEPIMDRLSGQIASLSGWGFLTDSSSKLLTMVAEAEADYVDLDRLHLAPGMCFGEDVIGTNAIGTSRELQRPFLVSGSEHFREPDSITTTGVPIFDPTTRRYMGTLGIHCRREYASGSLLPLVSELGRSIENQLLTQKPDKEREIFEAFLSAKRRFSGSVLAVTHDMMLSSAAARRLYGPADGELIQSVAREAASQNRESTVVRTLSNGRCVEFRSLPVPQPVGGFAAVLLMHERPEDATSTHRDGNEAIPVSDEIEQALLASKRVLLTGERGTGKRWFACKTFQSESPHEPALLDCAAVLPSAREWITEAKNLLATRQKIVLLHVDETPESIRGVLAVLVRNTDSSVVATCGEGSREDPQLAALMESFPVVVRVPPLRERRAEIPEICQEILANFGQEQGQDQVVVDSRKLAVRTLASLLDHDWPGNIRQLKQVLFTSAVRAGGTQIQESHLPSGYRSSAAGGHLTLMERTERQTLQAALNSCGGNRNSAAVRLGISRATMYRKLRRYQLN